MKIKGKYLNFLSRLEPGGRTQPLERGFGKEMDNTVFNVTSLSTAKGTFIAENVRSYVVQVKVAYLKAIEQSMKS